MIKWLRRRFEVRDRQNDYVICCPFCPGQADSKFHLYINKHKPVAHCFRCDWGGNYISLIMAVDTCSYADALVHIEDPIADIKRYDSIGTEAAIMQEDKHSKPPGFIFLHESSTLESRVVRAYVRKRRVPPRLVRKHFGFVPGTNRAWILIDKGWWQGRLIISGVPKYISPAWSCGDSLWNNKVLLTSQPIVVCEGVFSAIVIGDNAIALCSKTISDLQAQRIVAASPASVMIMLDYGAEEEAYKVASILSSVGYDGSISIQQMKYGDPADGVLGDVIDASWSSKVGYLLSKS